MLNWIRETFNGLFKTHTHCRCCGTPIENGGVGFYPCGMGFCRACRAAILSR